MAVDSKHVSLWDRLWLQLRASSILGWLIESNWADPFIFAIYSLFRPLASAFILVFMYLVVSPRSTAAPFFAQIYLGNAFFIYVSRVMMAISYAIIDDREHYEMLKYIYISPLRMFPFLAGRGMVNVVTTTVSVLFIVLLGVWPLGISIHLSSIDWVLFLVSFPIGIIALLFMGYLLAGVVLVLARHAWAIADGVAGVLYLLVGAVFPVNILPFWLWPLSFIFPVTYWLELLRRSLLGIPFNALLAGVPNWTLFFWLLLITSLYGLLSFFIFGWLEKLAKYRGLIDQITGE